MDTHTYRWIRLSLESLEERALLSASPNSVDTPVVNATSVVVTTLNDEVVEDDVISLREAIGLVDAGGTITFDKNLAGESIKLSGTQLIIDKSLTIDATALTGGITVDAQSKSRVFFISGGTSETPVTLKGVTITKGVGEKNGGGIYSEGFVNLISCKVSGNFVNYYDYFNSNGGGIYSSGTLTLTDCEFSENTAHNRGGGIYSVGTLMLTNCTVSKNTASNEYGGGIYASSGTLTLTNCEVSENSAQTTGGGIFTEAVLTLTNCTVSKNIANGGNGGGVYSKAALTLTSCTVSENSALRKGGGIYVFKNSSLILTNCLVSSNTASEEGGGIFVDYTTATLTNCTVSGNIGSINGGGISTFESALNVYNSIVSWNDTNGVSVNINGPLFGNSNNIIDEDPGFVEAPTFSEGKLSNTPNYHLLSTSKAVDAGNNELIEKYDVDTDLDGLKRIYKDTEKDPATVDIGAYERQPEDVSTIVTTKEDVVDAYDRKISLREAISVYSQVGDIVTFAKDLAGETFILSNGTLVIDKKLSIDASNFTKGITINANQQSRVFLVSGGTSEAPVEFIGLTITGGNTDDSGGGIYVSGAVALTNCTVSGNAASLSGGGFYVAGSVTLTNSTVSGNTASNGGGIYVAGAVTLASCTVSGNTASSSGGGIFAYAYTTVTLANCVVSGNTASDGGGISSVVSAPKICNSIVSRNYATVGSNLNGTLSSDSSNNLINFDEGFIEAPVFGSDGKLKNAKTMNLQLQEGSWAINQGKNEIVPAGITKDMAGNDRIYQAGSGGIVDIGAYEYQGGVTPEEYSPEVTTDEDVSRQDGKTTLREAIYFAQAGELINFSETLSGQTIDLLVGELYVGNAITIDATMLAGGITIDAQQKSRVFNIKTGTNDTPVALKGLTITGGNTASVGGGIYTINYLTLTNCAIIGNKGNYGGGVYSAKTLISTNSEFSGNTATTDGGGISFSSTLILTNCTVSGNTAGRSGGGVSAPQGVYKHTLNNSIVSQNEAGDIPNIRNNYSGNNNLVNETNVGFVVAPIFIEGKLSNTPDYHLKYGSQAIDAGSNGSIEGYDKDLDGNERILNGTVDIGAYETEERSTNVTIFNDVVDAHDGKISLREAITYTGTGSLGTTITFDSKHAGATITLSDDKGYKTLIIDKNLTIDASALTGGIKISGDDKNQIFAIGLETGDAVNVTLNGLTLIKGSSANSGGAIGVRNATLTLSGEMAFTDNHSVEGGGAIYITSTATVTTDANTTSLTFSGNYCGAGKNGGAIANYGTLTLNKATFTGNSAKEGKTKEFDWTTNTGGSGGALVNWKTATLTDCTFTTNYADNGGAIANGMTTKPTITYATLIIKQTEDYTGTMFSGNEACYGGAIFNAGGLQIGEENQAYAITLSGNKAYKNGGAISNSANGATGTALDLTKMYATLYNVTLSSNTALNAGAIVNQTALTTAQKSVFSGNSATGENGSGGAIDVLKDATLTTTDTTFTSNTATNGAGGALQVWGTATLGDRTTIGVKDKANSAQAGGGLSVTETGKATLTSTSAEKLVTIANNTATYGGGIYAYGDLVLGQNTSIASNNASKNGGGISLTYVTKTEGEKKISYCGSLTVTGANNTVTGNTAGTEATSGTTYYGGGIIANRGTYIDIANTDGKLTLSENKATKGKDVALDCVALVNSAYKTLSDKNLDRYISRCAEIYYETTLTDSKVSRFKLTSFTYQPSDDPSVIARYSVSGQCGTTDPDTYKTWTDLNPAVTELTFDIYASEAANAASIIYHLPTSGSEKPSEKLLESALNAYLEEELVY